MLQPGYFADVVVFDPATIADHATFESPHQYSTGMQHVFVNGTAVLKDGEHTGLIRDASSEARMEAEELDGAELPAGLLRPGIAGRMKFIQVGCLVRPTCFSFWPVG